MASFSSKGGETAITAYGEYHYHDHHVSGVAGTFEGGGKNDIHRVEQGEHGDESQQNRDKAADLLKIIRVCVCRKRGDVDLRKRNVRYSD